MSAYRYPGTQTQQVDDAFKEFEHFSSGADEIDDQDYKNSARDHVLFCIDASETMQRPLPDTEIPATGSKDPDEFEVKKGKSPLHIALEVVSAVQRGKIMTGPSDSVGVVLYNVDDSRIPEEDAEDPGGGGYDRFRTGTYTFQKLRQISATDIKKLLELLESANDEVDAQPDLLDTDRPQPDVLSQRFPPIEPEREVDIVTVFEACNSCFQDAGTKLLGAKRIFLITDNDRPERRPAGSRASYVDITNPARTRFNDLNSNGIVIEPFFVTLDPEKPFDKSIYWDEIFNIESSEDDNDELDAHVHAGNTGTGGLDKLKEIIEMQVTKTSTKRRLFSVPLRFGGKDGEIVIGVDGYSLIAKTNKPTYKQYDFSGREAMEVKTSTVYHNAASGDQVANEDIGHAFMFGGSEPYKMEGNYWREEMAAQREYEDTSGDYADDMDVNRAESVGAEGTAPEAAAPIRTRITFTEEEIKEFKSLGLDPQIKIIGFHDPSDLRFDQNIKHAIFIYPSEEAYAGSTRTFTALLNSCVRKQRHALALMVTRRSATPLMCRMVPQAESVTEEGIQDRPPGFHLIPMPYADDIRSRPDKMPLPDRLEVCTPDQKDAMGRLIKKFALAGKRYNPRAYPNPDLTFFYEKLNSLAFDEPFDGELIVDHTLPPTVGMHQKAGNEMQRLNDLVNEDERVARPISKLAGAKRGAEDEEADPLFIQKNFANGTESKLTVKMLDSYAKQMGIVISGKKADKTEQVRPVVMKALQEIGNKRRKA